MWLPQGGALKIGNLQFTQYSIIMLARSYTQRGNTHTHTQTDRERERERERTVTTNHHNNS